MTLITQLRKGKVSKLLLPLDMAKRRQVDYVAGEKVNDGHCFTLKKAVQKRLLRMLSEQVKYCPHPKNYVAFAKSQRPIITIIEAMQKKIGLK